ncbi:metallophosphoesterase family protein [Metabacillus idriensis]|uniref:metallophosphoesterase family protein n=1 Tax=Metabacillus idriensis TaxID=324768 RepID=UPI003D2E7B2C
MEPIRFIHAADLHIDSPFAGMQQMPETIFERLKESTFAALDKLIKLAISEQVDFILIAGDLFDGEDRSLKAQLKLKKAFEQLELNSIQVYAIHGNHDHMSGKWLALSWPQNVHIFSDKEVECKTFWKNGNTSVNLYGYSYPKRAVTQNMTPFYKKQSEADFNVGLLHGSIAGNNDHDVYSPFLISDLLEKQFDYWALGHIHKRTHLHESEPPILYSGNIQGRNRKETGDKGCYLVSMSEGTVSYTFKPLHDVKWEELLIEIKGSFEEWIDSLHLQLQELRSDEPRVVVIRISGISELYDSLQEENVLDDLIDQWNEDETERENFVWISSIINESMPEINKESLQLDSHFLADLTEIIKNFDDFESTVLPLKQNALYRKHIPAFDAAEQQQIEKEAEYMLFQELLKHRRL